MSLSSLTESFFRSRSRTGENICSRTGEHHIYVPVLELSLRTMNRLVEFPRTFLWFKIMRSG